MRARSGTSHRAAMPLGTGPLHRAYQANDGWFFLGARESDLQRICEVDGLGGNPGPARPGLGRCLAGTLPGQARPGLGQPAHCRRRRGSRRGLRLRRTNDRSLGQSPQPEPYPRPRGYRPGHHLRPCVPVVPHSRPPRKSCAPGPDGRPARYSKSTAWATTTSAWST